MKSPHSYRKSGALDWFCLRAIAFYQRELSPRKGWRCAYARVHGGAGCSGFARDAIANYGLRPAIPLVRTRFDDCRKAGQLLRNQHGEAEGDNKKRRGRRKNNSSSRADWCDCTDPTAFSFCKISRCHCADALIDCGPGDSGCCDIGDCNCSPCD